MTNGPPATGSAVATRITTVRHSATLFSGEHKIAGRLDVPLSDIGVVDAREFGAELFANDYDVVITSPLSRALETARLVTGLADSEILVRPGCVERDYGAMQGLEPDRIGLLRPRIRYVRVGEFEHSLNPPSGESFPALRTRAELFLKEVLGEHRERSVLIFSHQTFLQQLHGLLLGMDPFECLALDIGHLEMNYFGLDHDLRLVAHTRQTRETPSTSW